MPGYGQPGYNAFGSVWMKHAPLEEPPEVSLKRRPIFDRSIKLFEASAALDVELSARNDIMSSVAPGVTVRTSDGQSAHKNYTHDADTMSLNGFQTLKLSEMMHATRPNTLLGGDSLVESGGATVITEFPSVSFAPDTRGGDPRPPKTPPPSRGRSLRSHRADVRPHTAPYFMGSSVAGATFRPKRPPEYDLDGKIIPEDPDVFEVVHSVTVLTEDAAFLPVPLDPRPESPVSVTF